MKLEHVGRSALAGGVIYVVMAACSARDHATTSVASWADGGTAADTSGGTPGASGMSGKPASTAGSSGGGISDPVPSASAAPSDPPLPPETATESCDKTTANGLGHYAEHSYPGASAAELATSVAALLPSGGAALPTGYDTLSSTSLFVKAGAVAVQCSQGVSVAFVRRR